MTAQLPLIAALVLAVVFTSPGGEPGSLDNSTTKPVATNPSIRPPLPEHDRMLILQFEVKDGHTTLTARTGAEGRVKPAPSPAGRTGIYFRALNAEGALICDGMLPDPFIVRIPPPAAGAESTTARPAPPPDRDETSFLIRLPDVSALHSLELYRVPAGTPPATPRDAAEFRMGSFSLTKQ